MNEIPTPFEWDGVVKPHWIDDNGHMNVTRYMRVFYRSTTPFFNHIGIQFADDSGESVMQLGTNIDYKRELLEGDPFRSTIHLLDWDHNKAHVYCETFHAEKGFLAAHAELLFLYVDLANRRGRDFRAETQVALQQVLEAHKSLGTPASINRTLGIRRGR